MPLRCQDVATSDALLLREPPPPTAEAARSVLGALSKAGIHCIVPAAALATTPLSGAVPLVELRDLEAKLLLRTGDGANAGVVLGEDGTPRAPTSPDQPRSAPISHEEPRGAPAGSWCPAEGVLIWQVGLGDSGRLAVTIRGDESEEQLATLCAREVCRPEGILASPPAVSILWFASFARHIACTTRGVAGRDRRLAPRGADCALMSSNEP